MSLLVISEASRALLAAHARGGEMLETGRRLPGDRWEIEVDEEVVVELAKVDPDPDVAIRIMCTTGVGHS